MIDLWGISATAPAGRYGHRNCGLGCRQARLEGVRGTIRLERASEIAFDLVARRTVVLVAALTYQFIEQPGRRFFNELANKMRVKRPIQARKVHAKQVGFACVL